MIDEYKTPASNVEFGDGPFGLEFLPRFSAWAVFGLTIVTLGIYPIYWLYSRSQKINKVCQKPIPQWLVNAALITYTLVMVGNITPDKYYQELAVIIVGGIVSIMNIVFMIWWVFAVRSRLQMLVDPSKYTNFSIGPVLTFFFQAIYLQYKINQYLDEKVA